MACGRIKLASMRLRPLRKLRGNPIITVFDGFNDVKEEDKVEAYIMVEVPR